MSKSRKGNVVISQKQRKQISLVHKGKIVSEETRKKISKSLIGNTRRAGTETSEQARKNMSETHKGYVMPEEQKKKISEALKGKKKPPRTKEHREKLGKAARGRVQSAETRKKRSESMKKYWAKRKAREMLKLVDEEREPMFEIPGEE